MQLPLLGRPRPLALAVVFAAAATVLPLSTTAVADPVADAKARAAAAARSVAAAQSRVAREQAHIAAVQRQIAALNVQAEIAAEAYNEAVEKLARAGRVAGAARTRLVLATASLQRLRTRAGAVAVEAYRSGGMTQFALLIEAGGPASLLDREAALKAVSHAQRNTLAELQAAKHEQAFAKVAAESALAQQRELTADKRRERDAVLATARRQQDLLGQLQAAQARLVAQAQAAVASATAAKHAVDVAVAARALAHARARAAALTRQRAATAAAAAAFRAASLARPTGDRPARSPDAATQPHASQPDAAPLSDLPSTPALGSGGAAVAVRWAHRQIGKAYVWAADGPDTFDCSGLTQYVWAKAGVYLPHYSGAQVEQAQPVSRSGLAPGDLVFFGAPIHHVGIYVGGGKMINAPHTGALVREEPVWWPQYVGGARPG